MATDHGSPAPPSAPEQVSRLMDGYLSTQLLYVAAKLGIADVLAGGPMAAGDLAKSVGAAPRPLSRVLRGLAADGVLDELPDGRFALTALGGCLESDGSGSLHGAIVARGDLYFRAAAGLLEAVREGGVAFEREYGSSLFDYLNRHPERGKAFQASMADRSRREAAAVVPAYDFREFGRLVDVGGGTGTLLATILEAAPRLRGVLFDRPAVVARARERLAATSVADRCEFVAGDFFASVPAGGDAYLLSRVIHDWDDDAARRILATCHRAMEEGSILLLVEAVLPERAREQPAAIRMDLHMLLLLGGRERTAAEFDRLLASAGFRLTRVVPTASPAGIAIVEAMRGSAPAP